MTPQIAAPTGTLAQNVAHFARALRSGGLSVGPAQILDAQQAVKVAGLDSRRRLYWTLRATLLRRPTDAELFDRLFEMFWRNPNFEKILMAAFSPEMTLNDEAPPKPAERRAREAMQADQPPPPLPKSDDQEIEIDASMTWSDEERLRRMDFEQMTLDEERLARAAIARLSPPAPPILSRRLIANPRGRASDWRGAMRARMRSGDAAVLPRRARSTRPPSLVAICDVSGSMSRYARMLLHFLHAATQDKTGDCWGDVHAFVFGTRLTNISRALALKDVDAALTAAGRAAEDWEGGTRIGACLGRFNRDWSRRVLGQGAVVLLATDGLDRGEPDELTREAGRLGRSCRQLIWLNPLLRWDGYAPKSQGAQALLPHVHSVRSAHNVASLEDLARAIATPDDAGALRRLRTTS